MCPAPYVPEIDDRPVALGQRRTQIELILIRRELVEHMACQVANAWVVHAFAIPDAGRASPLLGIFQGANQ